MRNVIISMKNCKWSGLLDRWSNCSKNWRLCYCRCWGQCLCCPSLKVYWHKHCWLL